MRSAFSMTEPEVAGSDPKLIRTRARRDGDEWVIDGHKWFTSNGSRADFLITMAVTNPEAHAFAGSSMFIVPTNSPGLKIVRDVPTMSEPDHKTGDPGGHSEVIYDGCRIPYENVVGGEAGIGQGFVLAQKRLGPGRIHHAMRWLGISKRAFDMMCERAVSRFSHGSLLSEKQMVQDWVATSHAEMQAARLLTLHAAWKMDKVGASNARNEIAVIKFYGANVLYNVIDRAIQVHGALGFSTDMPLERMYRAARSARLVDGADEVHKVTVARRILKGYAPVEVPTEHRPTRRRFAQEKFAEYLDTMAVNA
jgi:acyl-CoA dehydrogenase